MHNITVIGHGLSARDLTLGAVEAFHSGRRVVLHTERCACADWLDAHGVAYESLDTLYELSEDFDEHTERAVARLTELSDTEEIVFGVFDLRDRVVRELKKRGVPMTLFAGPIVENLLMPDVDEAVLSVCAADWEETTFSSIYATVVREIDSRALAAELKLKLLDVYPDDWSCTVTLPEGDIAQIPLYKLDRLPAYNHAVSALVPAVRDFTRLERYDFEQFTRVIDALLGPNGCPWDRAQTHASLRPYMIEEAYEAVGAIDEGDIWHLADELGDVLLQIALHAGIAQRHGEFAMLDVTTAIAKKMIHRHSHVFGADIAQNSDAVSDLWNKNKMAERGQKTCVETMRDVPKSFPALMRAAKVLKRLDRACQRDATIYDALRHTQNTIAVLSSDRRNETRMGEAFLALTDLSRALGVDPEIALNRAVDELINRTELEEQDLPLSQMEEISRAKAWTRVKLWESNDDLQEQREI